MMNTEIMLSPVSIAENYDNKFFSEVDFKRQFSSRKLLLYLVIMVGLILTYNIEIGYSQPAQVPDMLSAAKWIGLQKNVDTNGGGPNNRFTYFRKEVLIEEFPEDATVLFAADSNARLWINGHMVGRKVSRYTMTNVTAEVINAAPYLRKGKNVIVILHHNWGDIQTFQRTGNAAAGLYLSGSWIHTDNSWKMLRAAQYIEHENQILGVPGTARIRYPQIIDARKKADGNIHLPSYNDGQWKQAVEIENGPWPEHPAPVETPPQREYPILPMKVLAAGRVKMEKPITDDPVAIGLSIKNATYIPSEEALDKANSLINQNPLVLRGKAGESRYVTFDFFRPVHGYPFIKLKDAVPGVKIDFGYAELSRSQYDGKWYVDRNTGWLDPTGVVGDRYADRYITASGAQYGEIPDERTARWLMVRVHFEDTGSIEIEKAGFIESQYPIDQIGTFSAGNEYLDQIVKLSLIHAKVTMTDSYVDTPGREDGQWYEDARLRAKIGARWFGDTRLREFMLRTVAESQQPDGKLHDFPPTNYPLVSTYDWTMQWAAILHDHYMWSGDADLVRRYWNNLKLYWTDLLSKVDDKGIWITPAVRADIRVGLHPQKGQSSGIVTPAIIERLRWSAQMAEAIGEDQQSKKWKKTANKMTRAFREYHIVSSSKDIPVHVADRYDPDDADIKRGFSQAGQTAAVYTGLLSNQEAKEDLSYAFTEPWGEPPQGVIRWNNPTFSYRVLRALSHVGMADLGVRHLIERFSQYLPGHPNNPTPLELQGPYGGPLPEYWISREDRNLKPGEKNTAQPVDDTGSHGWASIPLLWLHDTLLGVRLEEPGGAKISISPRTGGLPFVQGYTNTPKGKVWVSWEPEQWKLETVIPDKITAEIILPEPLEGKKIKVKGKEVDIQKINTSTYQVSGAGKYVFIAN